MRRAGRPDPAPARRVRLEPRAARPHERAALQAAQRNPLKLRLRELHLYLQGGRKRLALLAEVLALLGSYVAVGPYFAIFFAKFRPFFEKKNFREI